MTEKKSDFDSRMPVTRNRLREVIYEILGNNINEVYTKVINKELDAAISNKADLVKMCNKIKNLIALFIDKKKAKTIAAKLNDIILPL